MKKHLSPIVMVSALLLLGIGCRAKDANGLFVSGEHLVPVTGTLIRSTSYDTVYYRSATGRRYVFPNEKTYKTWYTDFSNVTTISDQALGGIPIAGNVTYRPGARLLKIETAPTIYVVASGGTLRPLANPDVAKKIYGDRWEGLVEDLPDAFFVNYAQGAAIVNANDFDPRKETSAAISIDADKGVKP